MARTIPLPKNKLKNAILSNITFALAMKNLSFGDLEQLLRCSRPTVNSKRKDPGKLTLDELMAIARVCDTTVEALVTPRAP